MRVLLLISITSSFITAAASTSCSAANAVNSDDASFDCMRTIGSSKKFYWTVSSDLSKITASLVSPTTGWIAVGFSSNQAMISSKVVAGKADGIQTFTITSRDPSGFQATTALSITNSVFSRSNGVTKITFTFPASLVTLGSSNGMVFAGGSSDTWEFHSDYGSFGWTPGFPSTTTTASLPQTTLQTTSSTAATTSSTQQASSSFMASTTTTATRTSTSATIATTAPTQSTTTTTTTTASSCTASSLADMDCMTVFGGTVTLHWRQLSSDLVSMVVQAQTTGYVAFGLTTGTYMVGGQVVIGWVSNGVATIRGYSLTIRDISGVTVDTSFSLSNTSGAETGGVTTLRFTRSWPQNRASNAVIWATGSQDALGNHDARGNSVWDPRVGSTTPPAQTAAATTTADVAAVVTLTLSTEISLIVDTVQFLTQVSTSVASALSVPASRVSAGNLRSGSVLVDTTISPSASGARSDHLAALLVVQSNNASSPLRTSSIGSLVLSASIATAPTAPTASCTPSTLRGLACMIAMGDMTVHWRSIDSTTISFALQAQTTGYVSFGTTPGSGMVGGEVVLGWVSGGAATVKAYSLTSKSVSGARENAAVTLSGISGDEAGGITTIRFTRQWAGTAPQTVIWAVGPSDELIGHYSKGVAVWGPASSDVETVSLVKKSHVAHAVLMIIGWGAILPSGALVARHFKFSAIWFKLHIGLQLTGLAVSTAAVIIAFAKFAPVSYNHGTIGITVMIIGWLQPMVGALRPDIMSPRRWMWSIAHFGLGRCVWALVWASFFLGVERLHDLDPSIPRVGLHIGVALLGLLFIVLATVFQIKFPAATSREVLERKGGGGMTPTPTSPVLSVSAHVVSPRVDGKTVAAEIPMRNFGV